MSLVRLLTAGKSLVGLKDEQARYRMSDPRALPKFGSSRNPFQKAGVQPVQGGSQQPNAPVGPSGAREASGLTPNRGLVVEAAGSSRSVPLDLPLERTGLCEPRRVSEVCGLDNSGSLRKSDAPRLAEPKVAEQTIERDGLADVAVPLTPPLSPRRGSSGAESAKDAGNAPADNSTPLTPTLSPGSTGVGSGTAANGGFKQLVSSFKTLFGVGQLRPGRKPGPARAVAQPVQGELRLDNVKVLRNDLSDTDFAIVTRPSRSVAHPVPPKVNGETSVPNDSAWERVATLFGAER
jgi:hypothetical protein